MPIRPRRPWWVLLVVLMARAAGAQTASQVTVSGIVQDQTGAVLQGATVELVTTAGAVAQTTSADDAGAFHFDKVSATSYEVRARFEGFTAAAVRVRVGARPPAPLKVVLRLAGLTQEITVSDRPAQVDTTASNNLDAVTVDQNMLESLPVFDQDVVATVSRFLDSGSIGTGGVTVVVNGMEVNALNVSASAVQQIKINQDPYSAEYSRPGRGRIEILTKPGSQEYHGDGNIILRDSRFNSRNAFASTKPPEQRRIFEGFFGGPVGTGGKTSFMLSANDQAEDQQAVVFALGISALGVPEPIRDTLPQPNRQALVAGSITHLFGAANTISIRPNYEYESRQNRGVGGTTLATAGTNFTHHEQQITYTQQTILRPSLVNQFQVLVGHEREPTTSASAAQGIVVAGAFTGGGAQGDLLRTETHMQLTENLTWTAGRHLVQAGFQLPDWSRRGFFDHSNFGGTFYFASLDAYNATPRQPYAFIQQRGNGDIVFLEKQIGTYIKDDWQARPGLSLSFGLRYDWQNYFHDDNNFAPRASFAYAPGNNRRDVIRGGAGIFNDRSGPVPIADLLHYQSGRLVRFLVTNPGFPDPFGSAASAASQPPSVVRLGPDAQIPYTVQYSLGIDHQLQKSTTLSVTYIGARGHALFRSRDINAPLPPLYDARPDPAFGAVRQIESNGRQSTDSLQVTMRGKVTRWFNGQMQYTLSRAYNDTNGIAAFPANDYNLAGEWARADFDRRHRFLLLGRISAGTLFDLGVGVTMNSGAPYTETLGLDVYNNGRGRARPAGVPRNSLEGAGYASLDLRASRDVKFGAGTAQARTITFALDAFNLLNRANDVNYVGTFGSPLFGQPVAALAPRQLQVSARVKF
jgi:outer membrane receptor protein involved in Fe transport